MKRWEITDKVMIFKKREENIEVKPLHRREDNQFHTMDTKDVGQRDHHRKHRIDQLTQVELVINQPPRQCVHRHRSGIAPPTLAAWCDTPTADTTNESTQAKTMKKFERNMNSCTGIGRPDCGMLGVMS
jgi:hypothetical protein